MYDFGRIIVDPRSGRPEPPVLWRATPFFVTMGWLLSAELLVVAWVTAGAGDMNGAALGVLGSALPVAIVECHRRKVRRAKLRFAEMLAAYQDVLAKTSD